MATIRYFEKEPDYRMIWDADADLKALEANMNLQPGDLEALQYAIELGIED